MVAHYIADYLFSHKSVSLKSLGRLTIEKKPAVLDKTSGKIEAPETHVKFSKEADKTDEGLIKEISSLKGITLNVAEKEVDSFIQEVRDITDKGEIYTLEGIGTFKKEGDSLVFHELEIGDNKESITLSPVKKAEDKPKEVEKKNPNDKKADPKGKKTKGKKEKKKRKFPILLVLLILVVLLGGTFTYLLIDTKVLDGVFKKGDALAENDTSANIGSDTVALNMDSLSNETDSIIDEEAEIVSDGGEETEEVESEADDENSTETESVASESSPSGSLIDSPQQRYFIIAGGFSNKQNAIKLMEEHKAKGVDSKILLPTDGKNLYSVTIGDYAEYENAVSEMKSKRSEFGNRIWVKYY